MLRTIRFSTDHKLIWYVLRPYNQGTARRTHFTSKLNYTDMTTPTLSLLVSAVSSPENVAQTLASLSRIPDSVTHEVFVVASGDETAPVASLVDEAGKLLPTTPEVLSLNTPFSHARAFNLAARSATGKHLLFLEAGTQLTEDTILPLLSRLQNSSATGIAAPLQICPESGRVQSCGTTFTPSLRAQPLFASFPATHPAVNKQRCLQAVPANGMFMRASDFQNAGHFDTNYFTGMEILDLCGTVRDKDLTIDLIPEATLLTPDIPKQISEDDLSVDTLRLNSRHKGCFGPDKHKLAQEEGYVFAISPWLESYITLTQEREQELTALMMQSPDPSTCFALIQEEPLWQTGYAQLAAYLESTRRFDEACGIRLLQTFFFPMLPLYRKLAATAEAANNADLLQMANDKLEHINTQLEDISALTKKAAGLANWARKAGEKELQALYEGWLKDLGLL